MNCVPVFALEMIDDSLRDRVEVLMNVFQEKYHCMPGFIANAPGRVNLIGEHVDYSGYSVLPMAIERSTLVAVASAEGLSRVGNVDEMFEEYEFDVNVFEIDDGVHAWYNYFLCGVKGIAEYGEGRVLDNFLVLVEGNVPQGSGLSSSSALVCSSALATSTFNQVNIDKETLAEISKLAERYVGVQSGGMDQAISFLGEEGSASRIYFDPVRSLPVTLPEGAVFFVANSLVQANKYVSADACYNMRVVECRLAAKILAKLTLPSSNFEIAVLKDYQDAIGADFNALIDFTIEHLHKEVYSRKEIATILDISEEELKNPEYIGKKIQSDNFDLHHRALHVFSESLNVESFYQICNTPDPEKTNIEKMMELGELMNKSHFTCRDNFDCSCPELNELTDLARESGAYGSRLTGAGWGGCTVSLVPQELADSFSKQLNLKYYTTKLCNSLDINQYLFSTKPNKGASIIKLNKKNYRFLYTTIPIWSLNELCA